MARVVDNDNRMLVGVAFAFLAICLLNTVGMLLAKFLKSAPGVGIRRALGATRGQIFRQYLTEAALLELATAAARGRPFRSGQENATPRAPGPTASPRNSSRIDTAGEGIA